MRRSPHNLPINVRRRGVAPGQSCHGPDAFGNAIPAGLNLPPPGAPHWTTPVTPISQGASISEILGLIKDLQASHQRTEADTPRAIRMLLTDLQSELFLRRGSTRL